MAGTDRSRASDRTGGPVIILVEPQLGENVGACARAMLNCGLEKLRLVRPRDGWPNEKAVANASGADIVLDQAQLYETVEEAISDLHRVYATTARRRDMLKPVMTPRAAATEMADHVAGGEAVGVLFGAERKGLHNEDVTRAQTIIEAPLNPAFASLNLAQAVLLVAWEWRMTADTTPDRFVPTTIEAGGATPPASQQELAYLFQHLESELDNAGFFFPANKRRVMIRNLRNIFVRANLTEPEVRTLRGVIKALATKRKGRG